MKRIVHFRGGFTLIELLVVIAILAILAALLLPGLSSAKGRATEVIDINNLKQVSVANHVYVNDNRDSLPWPNWKLGDSPKRPGWLYLFDPSKTGPDRYEIEEGLFWPILVNRKVYLCPVENTNSSLFTQRSQQISSYVMNGATIGYDRTNFPPEKLRTMQSTDVAFWEADNTQPDYFNDGSDRPYEGVTQRHFNGGVLTTFDGSVTHIRVGAWYVQAFETNKNSLWCYPRSLDGR